MANSVPRMRLNTPNFPGIDLVNKFIAATPSYMYSPIAGQHTFYFSELLRSLSQAKKAELINLSREAAVQQQLQATRKLGRKRGWGYLRSTDERSEQTESTPTNSDRPLELTSKHSAFTPRISPRKPESPVSTSPETPCTSKQVKFSHIEEEKRSSPEVQSTSPDVEVTEPSSSSVNNNANNTSDMAAPSIPPTWYHPLYPPYGIDPSNFFVDLRVSGHIFERKRELAAQALKSVANMNNNNMPSYFDNDFNKNRIGSAFSVPKSREIKSGNIMNLSANDRRCTSTCNSPELCHNPDEKDSLKNTTYVMHHHVQKSYNNINDNNNEEKHIFDRNDLRPKKFFDNGITVYNVDDSDDNGCKKQEDENTDSDDEETIRVDVN